MSETCTHCGSHVVKCSFCRQMLSLHGPMLRMTHGYFCDPDCVLGQTGAPDTNIDGAQNTRPAPSFGTTEEMHDHYSRTQEDV